MTTTKTYRPASVRQRVTNEEWLVRTDLAACYRLVARYGMSDLIYNHITAKVPGEAKHFLTGATMKPKFLGGGEPEIKPGEDRRAVMAKWLASPENPYFARNISIRTQRCSDSSRSISSNIAAVAGYVSRRPSTKSP